ncbi:MAG: RNA polymerase sigma factor RpoD, partial [Xanthomonadales bacterium]|nr:RNA polymerase sigma factor RpoD [Xanthomonadales bacterium]
MENPEKLQSQIQQQSEIKQLITKGREQGFLTYAEVNDHLPDDIVDPEQIEDIIGMINDMGIEVHETAPAESAIVQENPAAPPDEDATEEAVAALAALDADVGRTTDPVRMYMREMGTVELLTREGEIAIAKRIEEGLNQVQLALSNFPWSIQILLEEFELHLEGKKRLSEVLTGFLEFELGSDPPEEPESDEEEEVDASADDDSDGDSDDDDEDDDGEEEKANTGPDLVEVRTRMGQMREWYDEFQEVMSEHGLEHPRVVELRELMTSEFLMLRLPTQMIEGFTRKVREVVVSIRATERAITDLCVNKAKMPRRDFIRSFVGSETDKEWIDREIAKRTKYAANLKNVREQVLAEQDKRLLIERALHLATADIKDINRAMSIGEAKARRAKKEMVEA